MMHHSDTLRSAGLCKRPAWRRHECSSLIFEGLDAGRVTKFLPLVPVYRGEKAITILLWKTRNYGELLR